MMNGYIKPSWGMALLSLGLASAAHATSDGLARLDQFLKNTQQGQAAFVQVVSSPVRAGESKPRLKTSHGLFAFARPDRFRFEYTRPFPQTIVADGTTVWLYDPDLRQATARSQKSALAQTPAAVIAASTSVEGLKKDFDLKELPEQDGKRWVELTPKQADAQIKHMALGFEADRLAVLEVLDGFGQRATLQFDPFEPRVSQPAQAFVFKAPPGVSVLRP